MKNRKTQFINIVTCCLICFSFTLSHAQTETKTTTRTTLNSSSTYVLTKTANGETQRTKATGIAKTPYQAPEKPAAPEKLPPKPAPTKEQLLAYYDSIINDPNATDEAKAKATTAKDALTSN